MGQFTSKSLDGDPYIDLMRALPDRELIWWVQKVVWLAEGSTLLQHAGRMYNNVFMHKCSHCNGAGIVTCPHCNGYKIKRAHSHAFRLSERTSVGKLLAAADTKECQFCGGYLQWDMESDWQGMWQDWEKKLAYYDRTYGALFDEWHNEVVHEGQLDQDTQPEEEPMPDEDDPSMHAQISREVKKDKERTKALMKRFGGHPYESVMMLPKSVVDPKESLAWSQYQLVASGLALPPELNPQVFPELGLQGPDNPLAKFSEQIRMEYLLMNNLDAAIQDLPKPYQLGPSAGTVTCPDCDGIAWGYSWAPNMQRLLRNQPPFWLTTLANMNPEWNSWSALRSPWHPADQEQQQQPAAVAAPAAASGSSCSAGCSHGHHVHDHHGHDGEQQHHTSHHHHQHQHGQRQRQAGGGRQQGAAGYGHGEIPTRPLLTDREITDLQAGASSSRPDFGKEFVDYGQLNTQRMYSSPNPPAWFQDFGRRMVDPETVAPPDPDPQAYGPSDPLSRDPARALPEEEYQSALLRSSNPLQGSKALEAQWKLADAVNPAKRAARTLRDVRQLGKAETAEEKEAVLEWLESRQSIKSAQ